MQERNRRTAKSVASVVFPCSGAADVGAVADQAARRLAQDGSTRMLCLAGVGGRTPSIMGTTQSATTILVIDGCGLNCARTTLCLAGFKACIHLSLEDMGLEKGKTPVTAENIQKVAAQGKALLERARARRNQ